MSHLASASAAEPLSDDIFPQPDDVILVADVDEIVKPDVLLSLSRCSGKSGFNHVVIPTIGFVYHHRLIVMRTSCT